MSIITPFKDIECLAPVNAELVSVNSEIVTADDLNGLNLFLSPSKTIDGIDEKLSPALLRNMHHRSSELLDSPIRRDKNGGVYKVRRLKGNGLYSGPSEKWLHNVRNIKKDVTGYVLGLQTKKEYEDSLGNSRLLREMGIETEIPEGAFELHEIIYRTRNGVRRLPIGEAFDRAHLPPEYKDIPFVIRVDAIGSNHRLKDYIFADELLKGNQDKSAVRQALLRESSDFVRTEFLITGRELPPHIEDADDILPFVRFISGRIMSNVALMHKNHGTHGQLTTQNLTMDGKFIDYDTLKWRANGDEFDEFRQQDLQKVRQSLADFISAILESESDVLEESFRIYESVYQKK